MGVAVSGGWFDQVVLTAQPLSIPGGFFFDWSLSSVAVGVWLRYVHSEHQTNAPSSVAGVVCLLEEQE